VAESAPPAADSVVPQKPKPQLVKEGAMGVFIPTWVVIALLIVCTIGVVRSVVLGVRAMWREEDQRIRRAEWRWAQRYYELRDRLERDDEI